VEDAQVASEQPAKNYGTKTLANVGVVGGGARQSLLRFDLSAIPATATVTSATLTLTAYQSLPLGSSATLRAHRILSPWTEGTVTWSLFDASFSAAVEASAISNRMSPAAVSFDLTALAQAWVSGAAANHGLLLEQPETTTTNISTSESMTVSSQPRLDICYQPLICAPGFADCNNSGIDGCETDLSTLPAAEVCNGIDDNCSGEIDEGGVCEPISSWSAESNALDGTGSNHGTLMNGTTFGARGAQKAFQFDGTDDYVLIGNPANLRVTSGITVLAWVNPSQAPGPGGIYAIVAKWGQSAFTDAYELSLYNNGSTLSFLSGIGVPGSGDGGLSGGVGAVNAWTHVAMSYDAATGINRLYVNGVQVSQRSRPGGITSSNVNVEIGREGSYGIRHFRGRIDEVQIYGRALTAAEILAIFNAG
jgi:hypothetical protein